MVPMLSSDRYATLQALANTSWAFAVLGRLHPPFFRKLRHLTPRHMPHFNATELSQLFQVELVLRQEAPDLGMDTHDAQAYAELLQLLMKSGQLATAGRAVWHRASDPAVMVRTTQFQQVRLSACFYQRLASCKRSCCHGLHHPLPEGAPPCICLYQYLAPCNRSCCCGLYHPFPAGI